MTASLKIWRPYAHERNADRKNNLVYFRLDIGWQRLLFMIYPGKRQFLTSYLNFYQRVS
jgi:hypothetical protein